MQFYRMVKPCSSSFFAIATASLFLLASGVAQAECTFFTGFADNKDGTVTDTRNGLVWKRCAEGFDWENGACSGGGTQVDFKSANKLAQQSRFLGNSDWRLPTKEEFAMVVGSYDECKENEDGEFAASKAIAHKGGSYWASNGTSSFRTILTSINISTGSIAGSYSNYVRLVRTGHALGGEAALEFVNEPAENRKKFARQYLERKNRHAEKAAKNAAKDAYLRKEEEARQRREEQTLAAFRRSLSEGDDTSSGVIIQVKGNLVKIQTNDSQCSQRDYDGNCKNWINTPVEKWFKRSEVWPK